MLARGLLRGEGWRAGCEVWECLGFGDGGVGAAVEVEAWAGGGMDIVVVMERVERLRECGVDVGVCCVEAI